MKKLFLFSILSLGVTAAALAAAPEKPVAIPNKGGTITFDHAMHQEAKCESCHTGKPEGGKLSLNNKTGHKLCLDCHKAKQSEGAKVDCKSCHSGAKKK